MSNTEAGGVPVEIGHFPIEYDEQCFTMYMPISIDGGKNIAMPDRFEPFWPMVRAALLDYNKTFKYMYITVKNNYAKTGNYQNREGVHVDGYLTDDENYVYVHGEPTEYITPPTFSGPEDDVESLEAFEKMWKILLPTTAIKLMKPDYLYKLGKVLHRSPEIKKNHVRLFVKISFSNDKFNLKGNAHNYDLDYDWKMFDRGAVRNSPSNKDSVK